MTTKISRGRKRINLMRYRDTNLKRAHAGNTDPQHTMKKVIFFCTLIFVLFIILGVQASAGTKVTVCHEDINLSVSEQSVCAHLAHGDTSGECGFTEPPAPPVCDNTLCDDSNACTIDTAYCNGDQFVCSNTDVVCAVGEECVAGECIDPGFDCPCIPDLDTGNFGAWGCWADTSNPTKNVQAQNIMTFINNNFSQLFTAVCRHNEAIYTCATNDFGTQGLILRSDLTEAQFNDCLAYQNFHIETDPIPAQIPDNLTCEPL